MAKYNHFLLISAFVCLSACSNRTSETTFVIESPYPSKPVVTVVPVIDHSGHDLTWNISRELTYKIRSQLLQQNHVALLGEDEAYALSRKAGNDSHPFGLEIAWIKNAFPKNQFVAFFELFEHREMPLAQIEDNNSAQLKLGMRVRVFDVRSDEPKVILQETIEQAHYIPEEFTLDASGQVAWGHQNFEISPLGLAHEKLCQEVSRQVEDYVSLNTSLVP